MLTFQKIIATLIDFWEKQGCIIHQGYDLETGAGTFNPATFLRCLGPEPYNTAYVEPSRRPSDGRYGENPNRLQLFHQFQVIMKPSPSNILETYLASLRALGLDLSLHDIRFVHDDWESPTLGAWGLGWEVWLDGMEITQFTYFQAIGSVPLHPVSAEIAYGIERLAMYIQNVDNIFDVKWNDTLTFGDLIKQNEKEWSEYNFSQASVEMWKRHFDDFEQEAFRLISEKLPVPAYDFVLKASHAFNLLDARGAISVTERTGYIGRIRELARAVAVGYLQSREEAGFPLKGEQPESPPSFPSPLPDRSFQPVEKQDFLLEIRSEPLPATFVPIGMEGLKKAVSSLFNRFEIPFESITAYGTPQRIAVSVRNVASGKPEKREEKKGPPVTAVFDSEGVLTPLGKGFFSSIGITAGVDKNNLPDHGIILKKVKDTDYLFYTTVDPARSTFDILRESLPLLILGLEFPKKMHWGSSALSYARPIHGILALFGEEVIPFVLETIVSGRTTQGHLQRKPDALAIQAPRDYLSELRKAFVLADPEERKKSLFEQLQKAADGATIVNLETVLRQVLYLTEYPVVTEGTFREEFLSVPEEVLICEMIEHQKYFPLADPNTERLINRFLVAVDNIPCDTIRKGNERVLSARLADGSFLYRQDVNIPLETFNEKLRSMTFQKDLGSVFDKVIRTEKHVAVLEQVLGYASSAKRAAMLCKADLASALVGEFPELQGTIGKYYALAQGEDPETGAAIEEHRMPISESGSLPATDAGTTLALAEKIDNLLGYFGVGLKPSSSGDPYALRRQAFGILKILIERKQSLDLQKIFSLCATHFPSIRITSKHIEEILAFITQRAKSLFEDYGCKKDEIEAALQGVCIDPYKQFRKVTGLHAFKQTVQFSEFYQVYKRVKGLLQDTPSGYSFEILTLPVEKELIDRLISLRSRTEQTLAVSDFSETFSLLATLRSPLSDFLDTVKILDPDPSIRNSRIGLVREVFALFEPLLDFEKIKES